MNVGDLYVCKSQNTQKEIKLYPLEKDPRKVILKEKKQLMASQWTIQKLVTWRVKDWANCFLASKIPIGLPLYSIILNFILF